MIPSGESPLCFSASQPKVLKGCARNHHTIKIVILSPLFKALEEFSFEFSGRMVSPLLEKVIPGSHLHNGGEVSTRPDRDPLAGDLLPHDGIGLRLQPHAVDDGFFRSDQFDDEIDRFFSLVADMPKSFSISMIPSPLISM